MTGVGAEIGIPLMELGGYISLGARGMIVASYIYQGYTDNSMRMYKKGATEFLKIGVEDLAT